MYHKLINPLHEMKTFEITLPKVLKFEKDNRTMYNLPLHAIYHRKQYDLVKAIDPTKLKMPAGLMPGWDKGIEAESNLANESSLSEQTAKMLEKDRERDNLLKGIFYIVEGNKYSAVEANREAAYRIDAKLHVYANARKAPYDVESSLIIGLKKDMEGFSADIATLGLTASFAQLYTVNNEYIELQNARSLASADTQLPTAVVVRPQTDAAFDTVCQYIQTAYLNAATDEDKAMLDQLVNRMNTIARETRATQRQMLAKHKPKNPKDPKAPKDPKTPKDPKKPDGGGDDIQLPSEPPKKPDEEQPKPNPGGEGGGDDIQLPSEPPKKPEGTA